MAAADLFHPYGWKARIGLIVPSTNTINEPEFWRLAPPGITIHTSRVLLLGQTTQESYQRMGDAVDRAAEELATAEVDIVAYGCTSGSILCPLPELLERMRAKTGTPAIATAGSVVAALRASSGSMMPFRISFPPHSSRMRRTSSQFSRGSNWSAVHDDSDRMSATPCTWPTILPK